MLSHSTLSWDEPGDPVFLIEEHPMAFYFILWKDKLMCTKKSTTEGLSPPTSWNTIKDPSVRQDQL